MSADHGICGCPACFGPTTKYENTFMPTTDGNIELSTDPTTLPTVTCDNSTTVSGWTCPVCKGGVSPYVTRCPCTPLITEYALNVGTGTIIVKR